MGVVGRSSRDRNEATIDWVSDNWDSIRSRWATTTWLREATSGASRTAFTSSRGMPRSRKRRMTWATGTCDALVEAVAAGRVHLGRLQQPDIVVVPERLDAQVGHAGEVTDGHQYVHALDS